MKRQISEIEREIIERTNRASKCDSNDANTSDVHSNSQETGIQLLDSLGLYLNNFFFQDYFSMFTFVLECLTHP